MMVKNGGVFKFAILIGDKDIAGKCGDCFEINASGTVEIIGYSGGYYLVRANNQGQIYQYKYKAKIG